MRWIRAASFSILALLTIAFLSIAVAQTQAGDFEYAQPGGYGSLSTIYAVHYEMPGVFQTNKTQLISVSMNVTQFSQTASRIEARSLKITLTIKDREFVDTGGQPQWLERGKIWGPFTFSFLVTDRQIGLGPSEEIDATLKIAVDVVEYWHPPIGDPIAYPFSFSNPKQIAVKMINPAKKPSLSLSEMVELLLQQLGTSFVDRVIKLALGGGLFTVAIRFAMPKQFLPLLLAIGAVFVLVGALVIAYELEVFGGLLIVLAVILYTIMHRDQFA